MGKRTRISDAELLDRLRAAGAARGGSAALARRLGFTPQFISDVINGRRTISPRLALAMGYRQVVEFEPLENKVESLNG